MADMVEMHGVDTKYRYSAGEMLLVSVQVHSHGRARTRSCHFVLHHDNTMTIMSRLNYTQQYTSI